MVTQGRDIRITSDCIFFHPDLSIAVWPGHSHWMSEQPTEPKSHLQRPVMKLALMTTAFFLLNGGLFLLYIYLNRAYGVN